MNPRQRLRRRFLGLLKHTLNPLTRRLAHASIGPFSIVRHVGRCSGAVYETPIIVAPRADGFVIELTYGPDVDWHKNIVAAGGFTLLWRGKEYPIDTIQPLDTATGLAAFPMSQRLILRLTGRTHFERSPASTNSAAAAEARRYGREWRTTRRRWPRWSISTGCRCRGDLLDHPSITAARQAGLSAANCTALSTSPTSAIQQAPTWEGAYLASGSDAVMIASTG